MSNLVQNHKKILEELTKTCSHIESFSQVWQLKLSNLEFVAISLTAEDMSYNTESQLFIVIKGTGLEGKTEPSNYNKRRQKPVSYTENIRQCLSQKFSHLSNLFITYLRLMQSRRTLKYLRNEQNSARFQLQITPRLQRKCHCTPQISTM
jgi:hypothetical protein